MLEPVFQYLSENAPRWRSCRDWPRSSLEQCGQSGVFYGLSGVSGGQGDPVAWSNEQQTRTLMRLAQADLLTTFIITQHLGAIKRILISDRMTAEKSAAEQLAGGTISEDQAADRELAERILPRLLDGTEIASVGISHLTTSRRHLGQPAVEAKGVHGGYRISGTIPWVTGAPEVRRIVVGASLPNDDQILVLLSTQEPGVEAGPGAEMIAMSASCTDQVILRDVFVDQRRVLSGPRPNVLSTPKPSDANGAGNAPTGAGGLQTSVLAIGLSFAALDYLRSESERRENLIAIVERFDEEHATLERQILAAADGDPNYDSGTIRQAANGLVQRTTSAAMTTAKGAGMMIDHPVGRWCSQAFFFLVWSCPPPVAEAHLCDLVGLAQD